MVLNDRFEYETLWRYPISDELTKASGGKNNFFETGKLSSFDDLEKIRYDMENQYKKYNVETELKTVTFHFDQNQLDEFKRDGAVIIGINPFEINCENCFNPRLKSINLTGVYDNSNSMDVNEVSLFWNGKRYKLSLLRLNWKLYIWGLKFSQRLTIM